MKRKDRKDVGILTWHYYSNVGSALQAYALYYYIKKLGYTCEFINYRKYVDKSILFKAVRQICSDISDRFPKMLPDQYRFRIYAFRKKYFQESPFVKDEECLKALNNKYACFVCGSDQIWAPNVLDPVYLFDFVNEANYKFSYAASIGLNEIPKEMMSIYKNNLKKFNAISVREKQGENLLREFIEQPVCTVLDPTFLLDKREWQKIVKPLSIESFIFCYFLGNSDSYIKEIESHAKKYKLRVVRFEPNSRKKDGIKKYMGPEEFLAYINFSNLVITDSFHGVALSINLEKDFWVYKRFSEADPICQNTRITNILNICGLSERLVDENFEFGDHSKIDFSEVKLKLDVERKFSKKYLEECLKEGTEIEYIA